MNRNESNEELVKSVSVEDNIESPPSLSDSESAEDLSYMTKTLEDMIGKLSKGGDNSNDDKKTDPMQEGTSMLGSILNDNKDVMANLMKQMMSIGKGLNFNSLGNLECLAVRQALNLTNVMVGVGDEETYFDLKNSTNKLLELLQNDTFNDNKDSKQVLDEIKVYRKLFLQMYVDMLEKQIDIVKSEIEETDSQEYTVEEIKELGKRISAKR